MKILFKFKKVIGGIATFLIMQSTKVFSMSELYGVPQVLYGPPTQNKSLVLEKILTFARLFLIPIIFLIGICIYLKKSKADKKRKIITAILISIISVILYIVINYIITFRII